jgi:gamma-glutamyltranspeptidase
MAPASIAVALRPGPCDSIGQNPDRPGPLAGPGKERNDVSQLGPPLPLAADAPPGQELCRHLAAPGGPGRAHDAAPGRQCGRCGPGRGDRAHRGGPHGNGLGSDCFALVWEGGQLHGFNGRAVRPGPGRRHALPAATDAGAGWDTVTVPGAVDGWRTLAAASAGSPLPTSSPGDALMPRRAFSSRRSSRLGGPTPRRSTPPFRFRPRLPPRRARPRAGTAFRPPLLAETLAEIARTEGESFYRGPLAERIAAAAAAAGGSLTAADLANHRAEWVTPLARPFAGVLVHELPPNGQGITVLIALGILERLGVERYPVDGWRASISRSRR